MDNSKFHPLGEYIFCSTCHSSVEPKAIFLDEIPDEIIIEEKEETEYATQKPEEKIGTYKEKLAIAIYKKIYFVKCTSMKCRSESGYLFIKKIPVDSKFDGNEILKPEVIPYSYDWHFSCIENPNENGKSVIHQKPFNLYKNAISCFNSTMNVPCGFLIGAVIEAICAIEEIEPITIERLKRENIKDQPKLYHMLEDLVQQKSLSSEFSSLLSALRKVRNYSAHPKSDDEELKREELSVCITSIENLFDEMYIEPYRKRKRRQNAEESATYLSKRNAPR